MTLHELAQEAPHTPVHLYFRHASGATGELRTTAEYAATLNASERYFPPPGHTAASLGWGAPWWYRDELISWHRD